MKYIFFLFALFLSVSCLSMPNWIIIIRHGDGYYVPARNEEMGPALSKEGMLRTAVFLRYYLDVLVKKKDIPYPDYIFACDPYYAKSLHKMAQSVRHIQTVSPLVTWLYEHRINQTPEDLLQIPYRKNEYKKMAQLLTQQEYVDNKTILVCWSHETINKMIAAIKEYSGYDMETNWPTGSVWPGGEFESVVIIKCDNKNKKFVVDKISDALKIPETKEGKQELWNWFFAQFID